MYGMRSHVRVSGCQSAHLGSEDNCVEPVLSSNSTEVLDRSGRQAYKQAPKTAEPSPQPLFYILIPPIHQIKSETLYSFPFLLSQFLSKQVYNLSYKLLTSQGMADPLS